MIQLPIWLFAALCVAAIPTALMVSMVFVVFAFHVASVLLDAANKRKKGKEKR